MPLIYDDSPPKMSLQSYETLSETYERALLDENPDDKWLSEEEITRRALLEAEAAALRAQQAIEAKVAEIEAKKAATKPENLNAASPHELMTNLHKTLMSCSAHVAMKAPAASINKISGAVSSVLLGDAIKQLSELCAHLEDASKLKLLATDPGFVSPVVVQKLLILLASCKKLELRTQLLRMLGVLMICDSNNDTAVEGSVVAVVCHIMLKESPDQNVQGFGCRVLTLVPPELVLQHADGIKVMDQAIKLHMDCREVAEAGVGLFRSLVDLLAAADLLTTESTLQVLHAVFNKHSHCARIAESFCGCMWQLCRCYDSATTMARVGAIDTLLWCLTLHKNKHQVQEAAQGGLWQFARCEYADRVLECAGAEWGLQSLMWYAQHVGLLEYERLTRAPLWHATMGALKEDLKVHRVDLTHCQLGNEELESLATALQRNNYVRALNLDFNNIGDSGVTALSIVLTKETIGEVTLKGNAVGDEGAEALLQAICGHNSMIELDLSENVVSVAMIDEIAALIAQNRKESEQVVRRNTKAAKAARKSKAITRSEFSTKYEY